MWHNVRASRLDLRPERIGVRKWKPKTSPRGGQRPPVKPNALLCGDCPYVTFTVSELESHLAQTGHKKPTLLVSAKRTAIELTSYIALIAAGALATGFIVAALIMSAKILVFLGIPALWIYVWWIRRDHLLP